MNDIILRVKNLVKRYEDGFSLEIPERKFARGNIYCLVGANGAGKTTLLNLLCLLEQPDNGEIFFNEAQITGSNSFNIRRKITLVMENPFLFGASVFNNIAAGLKLRSVNKKARREMAEEALDMVGLKNFSNRYARNLSRGETQRVAIARSIVFKPEVLLLDEPFTNIDRQNVELIESLIKAIRQRYLATIIFTTHDFLQARRLSDEVVSLVDGKIVDAAGENFFSGEVEESDGLQLIRISSKISVAALTKNKGKVNISIHPQDIILTRSSIQSSARNSFKGIIRKIYMESSIVRLNIEVDKGVNFIVMVTKASYEAMRLLADTEIFLVFKATAVTVF